MLEEDKLALRNSTAAIRCKIIVKATETLPEIILTDGFDLKENEYPSVKDWTYTDERYVPQQGFIGQFVARTLSGNLQNISDEFNIENREIELKIGVMHIGSRFTFVTTEDGVRLLTDQGEYIILGDLGEDQTNWYSLGNFIVTNPEDNEVSDNTKFEAMDYAKRFNVKFDGDFVNDEFEQSLNTIVAVDEETVRLRSHIGQLREILELNEPVGRKLDFLIQEVNREINTTGSKCSDVEIAQVVVDVKSEIEKIREQIQNIE